MQIDDKELQRIKKKHIYHEFNLNEREIDFLISTIEGLYHRNSDLLRVLETVKSDVDTFAELTGIGRGKPVEVQAAEFNEEIRRWLKFEKQQYEQKDALRKEIEGLKGEVERLKSIREPVLWFAEQMELKLKENDYKGGWGDCDVVWLYERLQEEVKELGLCGPEEVTREAADVANFAMMIADVNRRGIS